MNSPLNLKPKHRQIIEAVLQKHLPDVEVWAYGSRANAKAMTAAT